MDEKKKGSEVFTGLVNGAVDFGKKAATDVKNGVATIVEKSKADEYARRLKKYNPLFPNQYQSEGFNIPNIIVIVDDAVRKGIDVCEGAIGWLAKESGEEVLHLYDEAIQFSGVQFIPSPICNAIYYVDHFDRNRYIQPDCIFSRTLKEKIDELQHIAESVGAKRCIIDITESSKSSKTNKKSADLGASTDSENGGKATASATVDYDHSSKTNANQHGRIEAEFTGLRFPKRPTLKWFSYDDSIRNLVETCCSGKRRVKKLTITLSGSTSATMSQSIATAIDGVMNNTLHVRGHASIKSQAKKEYQSELLFYIEF